ncbi:MAG: type III-B CRISPR module RAMP protein Cmr4 [Magnetococcales bacterium]|nr:type III-B CRISPR module RAMP protein Cmr4 [Magnetococcales bacterium]
MTVWQDVALSAIYTLTPTHCGTGSTSGAIDLPIAREAGSGFPVLPATSLKGVAREAWEKGNVQSTHPKEEPVTELFGPDPSKDETEVGLKAGRLAFTEGRLVAYPARAINRPFLHVTCPLILERLERDMRALGFKGFPFPHPSISHSSHKVLVADKDLLGESLVVEDLVYAKEEVNTSPELTQLAQGLAALLPRSEKATQERLQKGLVVIPDQDFHDLIQRAVPVAARIKLTQGKTTTPYKDPVTGDTDESGNLWYEEHLPAETLFVSFIGERRQVCGANQKKSAEGNQGESPPARVLGLDLFRQESDLIRVIQIGGNETVGQGVCFWNLHGNPWGISK